MVHFLSILKMKVSLCLLDIGIEELLVKFPCLLQFLHGDLLAGQLKPCLHLVILHFRTSYDLNTVAWHEHVGIWKIFWFTVTDYVAVWGLKELGITPVRCWGFPLFALLYVMCKGNSLVPQLIYLYLWQACRHTSLMFGSWLTISNFFATCFIWAALKSVVASDKHLARKFK